MQVADIGKPKKALPLELSNSQSLLLHSIVSHRRISCQCFNASDDRKPSRQFAMPVGYSGLMEVLSENGKASTPFHLISEVAHAETEQFLVRSKIECLMEITNNTSIRTLEKGTVLITRGTARVTSKQGVESYLHCTDKNGFYVYLNYNISGIFSPFAGPKNISGVHTVQSLLKSFRLPCTVRVVSGKIPRQACNDEQPGVFRLTEIRKEKTAMLIPLSVKQTLIPLSLKADVSFYRPANMQELSKLNIFNQIFDTSTHKVNQHLTSIQVLVRTRESAKLSHVRSKEDENTLFEDIDEIYPYIRRGGIPARMIRAQSLDSETIASSIRSNVYNRSHSQPIITGRERSGSLIVSQLLKQHTISSSTTETTFQFQSSSDSLTLGKTNVLRQFIDRYTSKESLSSSQEQSSGSSNDDIYFTLDNNNSCYNLHSVKDILSPEEEGDCISNRG